MRLTTIVKGLVAIIFAVIVTAAAILYSTDFNSYKDDIGALVREATGRDLIIEGDFKPTLGLRPSLVVDRVRFSNAAWGTRKEMMRIDKLRAELELLPAFFGDIRINQVVLSGADILLETRADGTGNWVIGPQTPDAIAAKPGAAPTIPTFDRILVENSRLVWRNGRTAKTSVVKIEQFRAQAESIDAPLRILLQAAFDDHPVALEGSIGSLNKVTAGAALPLNLTLFAGGAQGTLTGVIKSPVEGKGVDLKVTAGGQDLSALNGLTGLELPVIGPYDLSATLGNEAGRWQFKGLKLAVGGSDLAGTLVIDTNAKPVSVSASLTSALLRAVDFRDRDATGTDEESADTRPAPADTTKKARIFPDDALPADQLRGADIKVSLKANRLKTSRGFLSDISVDLSLKDGVLVIQPARATYAGGLVSAELRLDAARAVPRIRIEADVTKLDLAQIIKEAGYPGMMTGTVDAHASLTGTGHSVRSVMAGLDGTIQVTMKGGRIDGRLFDLLDSDALDAVSPWLSEDNAVEIKCLVGRYGIKNGDLQSEATVFDSNRLLVIGEGGVNLASEEIDFGVKPTARDVSLLKLVIPLRIRGTLASPDIQPDPGAIARGAVGVAAGFITGQVIGTVIGSILSGSSDSEQNDPCLAAFSGMSGKPPAGNAPTPQQDKSSPPGNEVEKALQGIGKGLKGLFGQ